MSDSPATPDTVEHRNSELHQILPRLCGKRVLVLGDVMLDEYLTGEVRRISPEAPVPIVDLKHRAHLPGGAANVAANLASLSGVAVLVGIVGNDDYAHHLRSILVAHQVNTEALVTANDRPTTTKTRIVSGQQQIVRLDRELASPPSRTQVDSIIAAFEQHISSADACLLSDYAKGVLSPEICAHVIARARQLGKLVVVDPKGASFSKYVGCSVITPNLRETEVASGQVVGSELDLQQAVLKLQATLTGTAVLVTRGPDGMTFFRDGVEVLHAPALAREVFDVTGAGDTVVSTLTLALASGATAEQAVLLANLAASIVVQKTGTATVSSGELRGALENAGRNRQAPLAAQPSLSS